MTLPANPILEVCFATGSDHQTITEAKQKGYQITMLPPGSTRHRELIFVITKWHCTEAKAAAIFAELDALAEAGADGPDEHLILNRYYYNYGPWPAPDLERWALELAEACGCLD